MSAARSSKPKLSKPRELTREHRIADFSCGKPELDDWLVRRALKNHGRGDSKVYVVIDETEAVVAYVAISAAAVTRDEATPRLRRNAPDPVAIGLIARLAVRSDMQGHGIGPALLREAVFRIVSAGEHIGIRGILVHAIDSEAAGFYERMGFRPSPIDDMSMMVSLREIAAELGRGPGQS